MGRPRVAIVGSRKMSAYGEQVTKRLTGELARAGVVIVSGLALGVDAAAHKATLDAGGITIAVLPTSVENIYPASHHGLAERIVEGGGTLISEYASNSPVYMVNFMARNRIISGLSDVVVITEAALKSGSLHTARFALDHGKTVMAVPGNITSPTSQGCNNLIKSGAIPVTGADDVLFAMGFKPVKSKAPQIFRGGELEQKLLELIAGGATSQEALALASGRDSTEVISALTLLEVSGHIRPQGAGSWTLS
jgi:DNA processing protein